MADCQTDDGSELLIDLESDQLLSPLDLKQEKPETSVVLLWPYALAFGTLESTRRLVLRQKL